MLSAHRSWFILGILVGCLLASAGFAAITRLGKSSGSTDSVVKARVLKLAHPLDAAHPNHLAAVRMAEELDKLSNGAMKLDIYPAGVLGSAGQTIEQLQGGTLDLSVVSAAELEAFVPALGILGLPYVFRDREHYWRVLDGAIGEEFLALTVPARLRGLAFFDAGSRSFYTKTRPVWSVADLAGLKIRVMNSRISMEMVSALGASPTPIAWGELYSALAQGTVDGAENNPPSYMANKHNEVAPFFTLDHHTRIPDLILVSEATWGRLDEPSRTALREAAHRASAFQRELWATMTEEALQRARASGVEVITLTDDREFRERTQSLRDAAAKTPAGSLLERIESEP